MKTYTGTAEELYVRGWDLIQDYYKNCNIIKNSRGYIREKLWDDAVDTLLRVVKTYDPDKRNGGTFEGYLYKCLKRKWKDQLNRRIEWKADPPETIYSHYMHTGDEYEKEILCIEDCNIHHIEVDDCIYTVIETLPPDLKKIAKLYLKYSDRGKLARKLRVNRQKASDLMKPVKKAMKIRLNNI